MQQTDGKSSSGSRRSFLQFGLAAAAGAALGGSPLHTLAAGAEASSRTQSGDEYGGLHMGIQSYSLRAMSLEKCLETMAHTLKLREVEIFPGHHQNMSPKAVVEMCQKHGIKPVAYGVVPFTRDHDANRRTFDVGKLLGIKVFSCDPQPDSFDSLDKLVEEYGIAAAIHPHGPEDKRWAKIEWIQKGIKDHHQKIGLCADTGHIIRIGEDPLTAVQTFKDRLYGLHLKDFKKVGENRWQDVPAGDGTLQVDAIVKFLLDQKFTGPVSIEYEGGEPVEAIQKTLERVKQAVKKARGNA